MTTYNIFDAHFNGASIQKNQPWDDRQVARLVAGTDGTIEAVLRAAIEAAVDTEMVRVEEVDEDGDVVDARVASVA